MLKTDTLLADILSKVKEAKALQTEQDMGIFGNKRVAPPEPIV